MTGYGDRPCLAELAWVCCFGISSALFIMGARKSRKAFSFHLFYLVFNLLLVFDLN